MGKQSDALFQRAQEVIPGGVNSPVRAFGGVGGTPPFIEQAQGSRIFDADNLQYIDCVGSWGPMILGHGHRYVVEAVKKAATRGFSFGAPTFGEIELAEMVVQAVPSIEMLRLVNSGTEATMSALRLARAATGRKRVIKFDGGYTAMSTRCWSRRDRAGRRSIHPTPRASPPRLRSSPAPCRTTTSTRCARR